MLSVMPNVIEKSARTVVMHGGVDYILIAEGTRCVPSVKISISAYSHEVHVQNCHPVSLRVAFAPALTELLILHCAET